MFNTNECGLLVVDIQGKLARMVSNSNATIANTAKLVACCQSLEIPVVVLEQNPSGLGSTVTEIEAVLNGAQKFEKYTFSALGEDNIKSHLLALNKSHWLVTGIEAHICVYQTVKSLLNEGINVEVIADCIDSRLKSNVDLAITNMRNLGANISSLEMCIYELMQTSKHPAFKAILGHIK